MIYSAGRDSLPAKIICILLFGVMIASAVLSSLGIFINAVWQLLLFASLVAVIEITVRYIMTDYQYIIDPQEELLSHNRLTVVSIIGKRRCNLFSGELCELSEVRVHRPYREIKAELGAVKTRASFCPDLKPKESYDLIFEHNDEISIIRLQCNERFVSELKKRLGVRPMR